MGDRKTKGWRPWILVTGLIGLSSVFIRGGRAAATNQGRATIEDIIMVDGKLWKVGYGSFRSGAARFAAAQEHLTADGAALRRRLIGGVRAGPARGASRLRPPQR